MNRKPCFFSAVAGGAVLVGFRIIPTIPTLGVDRMSNQIFELEKKLKEIDEIQNKMIEDLELIRGNIARLMKKVNMGKKKKGSD